MLQLVFTPTAIIFSPYCFHNAVCAWHVLHIHKRVSEELLKGDSGIWISLEQPQQKVSAFLGDPGPGRELMHQTQPYHIAPNSQDD